MIVGAFVLSRSQNVRRWAYAVCCVMLICALPAVAAESTGGAKEGTPVEAPKYVPPAYQNLRFEEDWSQMPAEGTGDYMDPLKKIPLSDSVWLSVGGKLRTRFEYWQNFGWLPNADDEYALFRAYVHTDWHFGTHWRVFVEGRWSDLTDRDLPGGKREALDYDRGDIWNAFIEAKYPVGGPTLTVRVGRQELQYGAQRLISPLDWVNNRRIFDGVLLRLKGSERPWQLDAFVTAPVRIDGNSLTWNDTVYQTLFSGVYYTQKFGGKKQFAFDVYALALNTIHDLPIEEDRYTLGGRVYGQVTPQWSFDVEAAYQFGCRDYQGLFYPVGRLPIDDDTISAWMFTAETTYTFTEVSWKPYAGIGFDYASGDNDRSDGRLGTFSPLYPLGHAFLGYMDFIGRQNILDVRGTLGAWPIDKKLKTEITWHAFWLASGDDALYNAGGGMQRNYLITTPGGRIVPAGERFVGHEVDWTLLYKFDKHLSLLLGYSHFFASHFIEDTGPSEDADFVYAQAEYTF